MVMTKGIPLKTALVSTAFALLVAALLVGFAWQRNAKPAISIDVLSYSPCASSVLVRVGITNTCRTALKFNQFNFNEASVRTESLSSWITRTTGPMTLIPYMPAVLKPGASTLSFITLLPGTLRWQGKYKVRTASLREPIILCIPTKWETLTRICQHLLADRDGPEQEIQSGLFECPNLSPPPMEREIRPFFDLDVPVPVGTYKSREVSDHAQISGQTSIYAYSTFR